MFFDNFINLCARKNVSQADVARAISISGAAISKWKEGGIPRDITLAKLATYFGVSVEELLRNENEPVAQSNELDLKDMMTKIEAALSADCAMFDGARLTDEDKLKAYGGIQFLKAQLAMKVANEKDRKNR